MHCVVLSAKSPRREIGICLRISHQWRIYIHWPNWKLRCFLRSSAWKGLVSKCTRSGVVILASFLLFLHLVSPLSMWVFCIQSFCQGLSGHSDLYPRGPSLTIPRSCQSFLASYLTHALDGDVLGPNSGLSVDHDSEVVWDLGTLGTVRFENVPKSHALLTSGIFAPEYLATKLHFLLAVEWICGSVFQAWHLGITARFRNVTDSLLCRFLKKNVESFFVVQFWQAVWWGRQTFPTHSS